jgi:pentalenene synthase/avermitilol synthase
VQELSFDLPFPSRISQAVESAAAHHVAWIQEHGLLGKESLREYYRWDVPGVAARFWPHARGADLELGTDIAGWFLLVDDQFDGPLGIQPHRVAQIIQQLIDVVHSPPGAVPRGNPTPAASGLASIWSRQVRGMSESWRQRSSRNWEDFLNAYTSETINRQSGTVPDVDTYLRLRHKAGLENVLIDYAERIGHYELPEVVFSMPEIQQMHNATVQVVNIIQDAFSVAKEEARGDFHNLVLVLQHHRHYSRQEALTETQSIVRRHTDEFLHLKSKLPALFDAAALPLADRESAYVFVDDLQAQMRACHDWCRTSSRYSRVIRARPDQPTYLEEMHMEGLG